MITNSYKTKKLLQDKNILENLLNNSKTMSIMTTIVKMKMIEKRLLNIILQ